MRKSLISLIAALAMANSVAHAEDMPPPPEHRPTEPMQRYTWDLICLAADNHWKINSGVEMTAADEADSAKLLDAATASGKAVGKDFQTVADELMPAFSVYLSLDRAYFNMTSGEMRAHCVKLINE